MSVTSFSELFDDLAQSSDRVDHYAGYSDEQICAIQARHVGSLVVTACPGAGKTRVLTERVLDLLRAGVSASELLVCTFTRASARELKVRLRARHRHIEDVAIGTLHGHAWRMTGGAGAYAGKRMISEEDLPLIAARIKQHDPRFSDLADREILLRAEVARERQDDPVLASILETAMAEQNLLDFAAILGSLKGQIRRRFKHVLVDEAQDLSPLQFELVRQLCHANGSLFLCGDDDQSLYGFRGAESGVLSRLAGQPAVKHLSLTQNYRCATAIVRHANAVIGNNPGRLPGTIKAHRKDPGEVRAQVFDDLSDELRFCQDWMAGHTDKIVLGRTREVLKPFEDLGMRTATIHEAKGQEWASVWLTGLENSRIPHIMGVYEEERRLMYVAMTRAKNRLFMSAARTRTEGADRQLRPSDFLLEAGGF